MLELATCSEVNPKSVLMVTVSYEEVSTCCEEERIRLESNVLVVEMCTRPRR